MEFVLAAVSGEGSTLKGKMPKWRHLQVVLTQLLLVGLLFFLILQNGQLKKEISSKLSHQFVQDIFNEKILQLSRDMEEIKMLLMQTGKENTLHHLETKKIIRLLFTQLGLPLSKLYKNTQADQFDDRKEFEVIQLRQIEIYLQRNSYSDEETDEQQVKNQFNEFNSPQQEEMEQFGQENIAQQTCSYYQYLKQHSNNRNTVQMKKLKIRQRNSLIDKTANLQAEDQQAEEKGNQTAMSPIRFGLSLLVIFGLAIILVSLCVGKGSRSTKWPKLYALIQFIFGSGKISKKRCFVVSQK